MLIKYKVIKNMLLVHKLLVMLDSIEKMGFKNLKNEIN